MTLDKDDSDEACSLRYRRGVGYRAAPICEHLARTGHGVAVADYNGDGAEHAAS
jgi:hypothetical protein